MVLWVCHSDKALMLGGVFRKFHSGRSSRRISPDRRRSRKAHERQVGYPWIQFNAMVPTQKHGFAVSRQSGRSMAGVRKPFRTRKDLLAPRSELSSSALTRI